MLFFKCHPFCIMNRLKVDLLTVVSESLSHWVWFMKKKIIQIDCINLFVEKIWIKRIICRWFWHRYLLFLIKKALHGFRKKCASQYWWLLWRFYTLFGTWKLQSAFTVIGKEWLDLILCSTKEKKKSYRFGTEWGCVKDDTTFFIFMWTSPSKEHSAL